ncbi:uncharacterized protein [Diabrotica undecimpunctata]|uniref:uncharacterized protein n=1 Tax=Diabrotica undecimpunctata TaxID=50387 RepID=UPI003B63D35E
MTNNRGLIIPTKLQDIIKDRHKARRAFQRTRRQEFKEYGDTLSEEIRVRLRSLTENQWHNNIRKAKENHGNVWKMPKAKRRGKQKMPQIMDNEGRHYETQGKVDAIARNMAAIHRQNQDMPDVRTRREVNYEYNRIKGRNELQIEEEDYTSPYEVARIIRKLKGSRAPRPEGIHNITLKELPRKIIVQLYYIFKFCLEKGHFPNNWKHAKIIPLLKSKKDGRRPESYRPISLLETMGKILEKIIYKRLMKHTERRGIIQEEQFGFRKGRNCELQLARIISDAKIKFNRRQRIGLAILDIEKAYDTVWKKALIFKVDKTRLPLYLINICDTYLSNRTFQVSAEMRTKRLYASGKDEERIIRNMENHLDKITRYTEKWKIKITAQKTQFIVFSQSLRPPQNQIRIGGNRIREEDSVKTSPLSKAKKIQLYQAYVRSVMLYAVSVWSSIAETHWRRLEATETSCYRIIDGTSWENRVTNATIRERLQYTPLREVAEKRTRYRNRELSANKLGTTQSDMERKILRVSLREHIGRTKQDKGERYNCAIEMVLGRTRSMTTKDGRETLYIGHKDVKIVVEENHKNGGNEIIYNVQDIPVITEENLLSDFRVQLPENGDIPYNIKEVTEHTMTLDIQSTSNNTPLVN